MYYTEKEFEQYGDYMDGVRIKIISLNKKINKVVKEKDIDIKDIKPKGDDWTFIYKLKDKTIGSIKYKSFTLYLREEISKKRDQKLNELGI